MGKKPRKIKHYKRSFSGPGSHSAQIRRVVTWIIVLALLFLLGFLIAKPGLDLASGLWYSLKDKAGQSASSQAVSEPESVSSQPEPQATEAPFEEQGAKNWAIVSLTAVQTPEKAAQTAEALAQQGVSAAVITLKDETGAVYYYSNVAMAQSAQSATAFDGAAVAKAFADAGIEPVAGIWAFKDSTAPYTDRSTAVKYQDTDYNWLDNSKELGGKTWLNPNSTVAQDYIGALIEEAAQMGYTKTLVFGLQFPTGYSLDACGYGNLTQSKNALLSALGQRYEQTENTEVWFGFDQTALEGTDIVAHGASPAEFGLKRILVLGHSSSVTNEQGEQTLTLPHTDEKALAELLATMQAKGTQSAGYYLFGYSAAESQSAIDNAKSAGYSAVVAAF